MKRKLQIVVILSAFYILLGSLSGANAQAITGNYQKASISDTEIRSAAKFAVKTFKKEKKKQNARISLVSIERAAVQIVAGTNYKLCLKVMINREIQSITTVVFKNLKNKYSVSSWEKGCQETV